MVHEIVGHRLTVGRRMRPASHVTGYQSHVTVHVGPSVIESDRASSLPFGVDTFDGLCSNVHEQCQQSTRLW